MDCGQKAYAAAAFGGAGLHDRRGFGNRGICQRDADVRLRGERDILVAASFRIPARHLVGGVRHKLLGEVHPVEDVQAGQDDASAAVLFDHMHHGASQAFTRAA